MVKAVSNRIARDRSVVDVFAFIAAMPPAAAALAMLYLGAGALADPEDIGRSGILNMLIMAVLFAFLFVVVARWTYDAVRAGLTPQRVQAMWLRRFQSESGDAFRTSRVIDRLSRHGVAALTLQNRDVQLPMEHLRNRLAPMFWLLFIPLTLTIAYLVWQSWAGIMDLAPARDLRTAIAQIVDPFFALIIVAAFMLAGLILEALATVLLVMIATGIVGPIRARLSPDSDDFQELPRLLGRIGRGNGERAAAVVRVSDANWREAVAASLAAVDIAIIDVSDMSEHVAWEIGEAVKACGAAALVFIRREDADFNDQAKAAVQAAMGRAPRHIITYPNSHSSDARAFAEELRKHVYEAADMRHALTV